MICEIKSTKGSVKSMSYQANDKGFAIEVGRNGLIGDDPKEWHKQMRAIERQYDRANFENKRVTQVISLTKEEAKEMKSAKDWEDLAIKHFEKKGIDLKNHAYIMHTHGSTSNPHLHVTISRVNFSGKNGIKDNKIGEEFGKITNQIAKERGWNTAKETAEIKRIAVGKSINEVLRKEKVKDFSAFSQAMYKRGYSVKIVQSEAKGIYGMRLIPNDEYTETPSPRLAKSGQGYKLSEIEKSAEKKIKFKIDDIKSELEKNKIDAEREIKDTIDREKLRRLVKINTESREERFERANVNINNRIEELIKKEENINFGNDIDPILREEIGKEFPTENVWMIIDEQGGRDYQNKIFHKIEKAEGREVQESIEKSKVAIETPQKISQDNSEFDRAKIDKEEMQEKRRGFRRLY